MKFMGKYLRMQIQGFLLGIVLLMQLLPVPKVLADELVVYSSRSEELIKPLLDAYTTETGIQITLFTDKVEPLLQRLISEGESSPVDLLITTDAGSLWHAARAGILQHVDSKVLRDNIPEQYRDPNMHWFGLSVRARTIVYSTERVSPRELSSYESLGSPIWKDRLLLSTSRSIYNQSLVALLLTDLGKNLTEVVVRSWVNNLAIEPLSDDTKVMEAILDGQGDVGIVNNYYFGRLLKKKPDLKLAIFWPNQETSGVYVNVSGAGVVRYSRHRKEAIDFIEWLSSEKAQNLFADANFEYPVNPKVTAHSYVAAWGEFKASEQNLAIIGLLQDEAVRIIDAAGYK